MMFRGVRFDEIWPKNLGVSYTRENTEVLKVYVSFQLQKLAMGFLNTVINRIWLLLCVMTITLMERFGTECIYDFRSSLEYVNK